MAVELDVTEWMEGFVGFGAADYASGEAAGKAANTTFAHDVLIEMVDIDRFVAEPTHTAPMTGKVVWLGTEIPFTGGEFNMLVASTDPKLKYMFYRIPFVAGGRPMTMLGYKTLVDGGPTNVWGAITTLYVRIYDRDVPGHDFEKPVGDTPVWPDGPVALGIIHISLEDGIKSAMSFAAPGASELHKLEAIEKFLAFYGKDLAKQFL